MFCFRDKLFVLGTIIRICSGLKLDYAQLPFLAVFRKPFIPAIGPAIGPIFNFLYYLSNPDSKRRAIKFKLSSLSD